MNQLLKLSILVLEAALYALGPIGIAWVNREYSTRFLGPAMIGYGAAGALFFWELVVDRRLPHLSFKSFQASVSLALVAFAVPQTVHFATLYFFSPVFVVLMSMAAPLWLFIYRVGTGKARLSFLAVALAAPLVFLFGTIKGAEHISTAFVAYGLMLVACFSFSLGIGFCKRIFWIHSSSALAFWALTIGSIGLTFFAYLSGELDKRTPVTNKNMALLFVIGALSLGTGTFLYRFLAFRASNRMKIFSTVAIAIAAFGLTRLIFPAQAPINLYTMLGWGVTVLTLSIASVSEGAHQWFSLYLSNSVRQGDRVVCHLKGFIRKDDGPIGKLVVHDLSIGGLGFKTDTPFKVADHVLVTLPIGENWSQVTVDCRVVHWQKLGPDSEMPFLGGLEFLKLDEESIQHLVEFLARIGHNPLAQKVA